MSARLKRSFTVDGSLSKLVSAQGGTYEDYIRDCVTGLFGSDIDNSFGVGTTMYEELHKLNDALKVLNAG